MKIITDSQEQRNQHILQEFSKQDIHFKVKKLSFGDYTLEGHENNIMIERKAHLTEISGNFCNGRTRFENEFIRAKEAGAIIYLLIEDEKARDKMISRKKYDKYIKKVNNKWVWIENKEFPKITLKKALSKTWRSMFYANSMINAIDSWRIKYDIKLVFCKKSETGKKIVEILKSYIQDNSIMI